MAVAMDEFKTFTDENLTVVLRRRPAGFPTEEDFGIKREPLPELNGDGVIYRTRFLSVDPYLRGRMRDAKSYVEPFALGAPIVSGFVGEVIASRNSAFAVGSLITGLGPWARFVASSGEGLSPVPDSIPPSAVLGVLGMPGLTAYVGLFDIGKPRAEETVVVSAASGAVGSLVVQLAKLRGCSVVGIAGSEEKCRYVVNELGADACVDYRRENVSDSLKIHCPQGIDVYFDNVGGPMLEAVFDNLRDHARIAVCGMISEYNAETPPPGPNLRPLLVHKVLIQGFIVGEHWNRSEAFIREVGPHIASGKIKYREHVTQGLENAPAALIGLLRGENFGKAIVRV